MTEGTDRSRFSTYEATYKDLQHVANTKEIETDGVPFGSSHTSRFAGFWSKSRN